MVTLNSVNYDSFVKTTLRDGSILSPTLDPSPVGFSFLQPLFAKKGLDNVITRFTGVGSFEAAFGSDIDAVKKYWHGGLVAREILNGGGAVEACRLMPLDAHKASVILCVNVSAVTDVVVGQDPVTDDDIIEDGKKVIITTKPYDYTKNYAQNFASSSKTISTIQYTEYPLLALKVTGRGTYGNDIGFRLYPDPERDGRKTGDGARYILDIYERQESGAISKLGNSYEVISAAFNQSAIAIAGSDIPDSFDIVFDQYAAKYKLPVTQEYSPENFVAITESLKDYAGTTEAVMIDFIRCLDHTGTKYPNIELVTAATGAIDTTSNTITYLTGGTDGDMFDNTAVTLYDTDGTTVIGTTTKSAACRTQLLIDFYRGLIDDGIYDPRIIDAGVTLDAWWPLEVKKTMVGYFGSEVRDDIYIFVDLGEEVYTLTQAEAVARDIAGSVSHPYGSVTINIHNGLTTNRSRNLRTSGNYEVASSIPSLYNSRGPFTVLAGFISGRVRNMKFDFYPKVVKDNLQIQPLRDKNLLFAMKLDRSGNFYFMSDDSQYASQYSVLGSSRNLIFAGEVIRTFKKVLAKYSFHPGNAAAAIPESTAELKTIFAGSYFPSNIPVTFSIFQTRNDKINKTATVDVSIVFPDMIESWKVTITANRQPIK